MRYRGEADAYPHLFGELLEFFGCEICPIIGDNAMGDSEPTSYPFEEIHGRGRWSIGDGYGLNPLGEFFDCNQEVSVSAVGGFREGANHVESPLSEGP